MCRVQDCKQFHSKHYCRVCQSSDSNHSASFCPNSFQVFHGTSEEFAYKIKQNGWKLTSQEKGRIGEGVYFATDYNVAKKIAIGKYGQGYWAVLQCRIPSFQQVQYKEKQEGFWARCGTACLIIAVDVQKKLQFQKQIHGPWKNHVEHNFTQIVVRKNKVHNIKIVKIWK